ncbi:hypothetical protein HKBW3S06_00239 [Candidatus Hakubella thermalkaliphila]|uniref:Uncharacterized protein n=1 Tax=Candidatus Hakubella thermalkaliphila TaxID=2754717 RepID=A0A6V8QF73_9ACTN|nr:hypothetical protein [Candidatus Hakubella thermalkaliphila]MBT9167287.1 hypothetical protein [Bacillota bacterium]GFP21013.1 hypothetical protein HKBW3S06_00239 [Candidatus Hakubella thermalkaliphila]GFP43393.1 hypothetical protein HKBW3C_02523 [Candidatus Hakubella thermalkaliphila]
MRKGVSYFGNRYINHFQNDLEEMKAHGCNAIIHTFSENDLLFYSGTLAEMVELSHKAGFQVYIGSWGVGGIFGGEAFSQFVMKNPAACQVRLDGKPTPAACMNNPAFRDFMKTWIDAAVSLGGDYIFWDEPHFHFPEEVRAEVLDEKKQLDTQKLSSLLAAGEIPWTCYCDVCRRLYREKFGQEMPEALDESIVLFREETILNFLAEMLAYSGEKGQKNAVCLLPTENPLIAGVTKWEKVAGLAGLDMIATDPYWFVWGQKVEEFVPYFTHKVLALGEEFHLETQVWVQAFSVPAGREEEVRKAVELIAGLGVKNIAAWSYRAASPMSAIKSANPSLVWRILGETYRKL